MVRLQTWLLVAAVLGLLAASASKFGLWKTWGVLSALIIGRAVKTFAGRAKAYPRDQKKKAVPLPARLEVSGFTRARDLRFFCLDDQVMGGRSASAVAATPEGLMEFCGVINMTGGGFCSCRTLGDEEPLGLPSDAAAVEVAGVGDGQQYKLVLHTADAWAFKPVWAHDFLTAPGARSVWRLLLRDFKPSRQGRPAENAEPLDVEAVTGLGLSLSLYTADGAPNKVLSDGPFRLKLESIKVV